MDRGSRGHRNLPQRSRGHRNPLLSMFLVFSTSNCYSSMFLLIWSSLTQAVSILSTEHLYLVKELEPGEGSSELLQADPAPRQRSSFRLETRSLGSKKSIFDHLQFVMQFSPFFLPFTPAAIPLSSRTIVLCIMYISSILSLKKQRNRA